MRTAVIILLSSLLCAGLAGCRSEEQDRIKMYQKGVYLGAQGTELNEDQVRELAGHTRRQAAW